MRLYRRRCAFLDQNGKQCPHAGKHPTEYHGDNEIYSHLGEPNRATWVRVYFCDEHKIE